jgi:hypothetical protein
VEDTCTFQKTYGLGKVKLKIKQPGRPEIYKLLLNVEKSCLFSICHLLRYSEVSSCSISIVVNL